MTSAPEIESLIPAAVCGCAAAMCSIVYRPSRAKARMFPARLNSQKSSSATNYYRANIRMFFLFFKTILFSFSLPRQPPTSPAVKTHVIIQKYRIDIAQNVAVDGDVQLLLAFPPPPDRSK